MSKRRAPESSRDGKAAKRAEEGKTKDGTDILQVFTERLTGDHDNRNGSWYEEHSARKTTNQEKIQAWADGALKRWQIKLRKAGVERSSMTGYEPNSLVPVTKRVAGKPWVLCVGVSHLARSTYFSVGAGDTVGETKEGAEEWNIKSYHGYSHAHPVLFFAERPEDLWPGSRWAITDLALLVAAGVCFQIYHEAVPHPEHRRDVASAWGSNAGEWGRYDVIHDTIPFIAEDDQELIAGTEAAARRFVKSIRTHASQRHAEIKSTMENLQVQLHANKQLARSLPRTTAPPS